MSQHIYTDGETTVTLGYDRPLNYVFCIVNIEDEIAYSNLDDLDAGTFCQDVDYYRDVLENLGIELPEAMFEAVQQDFIHEVGNKVVEYKKNG